METQLSRRKFITTSAAIVAGSTLATANIPLVNTQGELTIAQVIDIIKTEIQLDVSKGTVDTIKSGDPDQIVTGIVSTMFATVDVIRHAIALKANFIIVHEPTFYNHLDETDWLADHQVYKMKRDLLEKNNIVIWRFHDYWHAHKPDGIMTGVLNKLGWERSYDVDAGVISIPAQSLKDIIGHLKSSLSIPTVRFIGSLDHSCARIVLQPGAYGGRNHMKAIHSRNPDLFICGELQEWETSEYIRDTRSLGQNTSLIVLGHVVSEEPGMEWLVSWLREKVKGINVNHIPSLNPFAWA